MYRLEKALHTVYFVKKNKIKNNNSSFKAKRAQGCVIARADSALAFKESAIKHKVEI